MFNAVRRGPALSRAFQVCAPRALQSAKTAPALAANFRTSLPSASYKAASQVRLFQSTSFRKQAGAAAAQRLDGSKPITEFEELAAQGHVHPRIVHNIVTGMGINTMTDVQSLTIPHTIQGVDT